MRPNAPLMRVVALLAAAAAVLIGNAAVVSGGGGERAMGIGTGSLNAYNADNSSSSSRRRNSSNNNDSSSSNSGEGRSGAFRRLRRDHRPARKSSGPAGASAVASSAALTGFPRKVLDFSKTVPFPAPLGGCPYKSGRCKFLGAAGRGG